MSNPPKSNASNSQKLAFYKQPQQKSNIYQFEEKDIARSTFIQQRYKQSTEEITNFKQVTEESSASQSGLKLGDTVTKINQVETKNMSLTEANKIIQQEGTQLQLSVRRLILKNFEFIFYLLHQAQNFVLVLRKMKNRLP